MRFPHTFGICAILLLLTSGTVRTQSGPSYHWTFDETSGSQVIDQGGAVGTLNGRVTHVTGVVGSGALAFEPDATAFVNLGTTVGQFGTADFTVSLWVRSNEPVRSDVLGFAQKANSLELSIGTLFGNNSSSAILWEASSGYGASGPPLTDSQWHLLTLRREGGRHFVFFDGQLAAVGGSTAVAPIVVGSVTNELHIGAFRSRSAHMEVDDLRIWNRLLSDGEIAALYSPPPPQATMSNVGCGVIEPAPIRLLQNHYPEQCDVLQSPISARVWASIGDGLLTSPGQQNTQLWRTPANGDTPELIRELSGLTTVARAGTLGVFAGTETGDTIGSVWSTDGSAAGTLKVHAALNVLRIVAADERAFIAAFGPGNTGGELWVTDGSTAGTHLLKSFVTVPTYLRWLNGRLWFRGQDAATGSDLWVSDGTEAGTFSLDVSAGSLSSVPSGMTAVGPVVYFAASRGDVGRELFKSDGTSQGTVLVKDVLPGTGSSLQTHPEAISFGSLNGRVYFPATTVSGLGGQSQTELWSSDGTAGGTALVADINPTSGGVPSAALFAPLDNRLLFTGNNGTSGIELWSTDGTAAGTTMLRDIRPGTLTSSISEFTRVANRVFFRATDGVNGSELYQTDGTTDGTIRVANLSPGSSDSTPQSLVAFGGSLYFGAAHPSTIAAVWALDVDIDPPTIDVWHSANGMAGWNLSAPALVQVVVADPEESLTGPPVCTVDGASIEVSGQAPSYTLSISPEGTHVVECSVTDSAGHVATDSDTVRIDTVSPTIAVTHTADGGGGYNLTSPVVVQVSITNTPGSPIGSPTCTVDGILAALQNGPLLYGLPISGDGAHAVACAVSDEAGNESMATDTVLLDTQPPVFATLAAVDALTSTSSPIAVSYGTVTAHDVVSGHLVATCAPESGSLFALGSTTVTCSAIDQAGHIASASFSVSVDLDSDGDGIGNTSDPDDDNDGALDGADAFPLDAGEQTDTDGDGIGNNADPDDDNDGYPDGQQPPSSGPRDTVQSVGTSLTALTAQLPVASARKVTRAIGHLTASAAPELWRDATHLTDMGQTVFEQHRLAVRDLAAVRPAVAGVTSAITAVLAVDRALASTAIADAITAGGDARSVALAVRARARGDAAAAAGQPARAVAAYRDGWLLAMRAVANMPVLFPAGTALRSTMDRMTALLPTGSRDDDRRLTRAVTNVQNALDASLWVDVAHLAANGERVFNQLSNAVDALHSLVESSDEVVAVMDVLITTGRAIASTAIDEANAANGRPALLDRAADALQHGDDDTDGPGGRNAIDYYRQAWRLALNSRR